MGASAAPSVADPTWRPAAPGRGEGVPARLKRRRSTRTEPSGRRGRPVDSAGMSAAVVVPGTGVRDHKLLFLTCCLLGMMYLPREIVPSGAGMAPTIAALAVVLAVRYRVFDGAKATGVELAVIVFGLWVSVRLLLLGPLEGEAIEPSFVFREIAALAIGLILYRLGRRAELRPAIIAGLVVTAGLLLLVTGYQQAVGLPPLLARGYTTDNGYYYYTVDGTYRPFALFNGPTVFGGYLAMIGVFLTLTWRSWWLTAGLVVGVLLTQTRSAWIGLAVAGLVLALHSPAVRRRLSILALPATGLVVALSIISPATTSFVVERALSATEQGDTSRVTRSSLWQGVWEAVWTGNPVSGLGNADWVSTMSPHVSAAVVMLGHTHSNYLQVHYRYGLVGLALFLVLLLTLIHECRPRTSAPYSLASLGAVVVFLVDSTFNNGMSSLNLFVTLLLIVGLGAEPLHPNARGLRGPPSGLPRTRAAVEPAPLDPRPHPESGRVGDDDRGSHAHSVEPAQRLQRGGTDGEDQQRHRRRPSHRRPL